MKQLAIFASGEGTNSANIINYFKHHPDIATAIVLSDRQNAPVLEKAALAGIPAQYFTKNEFYEEDKILNLLVSKKIDLIVLAGFLKLVPEKIIRHFPEKIINIHPALLPKYGGKGMHGMKVHEAVFNNKEQETGITIHYVNEHFDEGKIIFQKKIPLSPDDLPADISHKVRALELECFPKVIENLLNQTV